MNVTGRFGIFNPQPQLHEVKQPMVTPQPPTLLTGVGVEAEAAAMNRTENVQSEDEAEGNLSLSCPEADTNSRKETE